MNRIQKIEVMTNAARTLSDALYDWQKKALTNNLISYCSASRNIFLLVSEDLLKDKKLAAHNREKVERAANVVRNELRSTMIRDVLDTEDEVEYKRETAAMSMKAMQVANIMHEVWRETWDNLSHKARLTAIP
jgi:hypothetical protein